MTTHAPMIGKSCPAGSGGRNCTCCGQAPGKARKIQRRVEKSAERNSVKREIRNENY